MGREANVLVCLAKNLDFVLQPGADAAHVHKVKVTAVHPLVFDVVDEKLEIRGDP
jgi:hypothetical protein